jgi:hypothetical protein
VERILAVLNSNAVVIIRSKQHKSALERDEKGKLLTPENRGAKHNQRTLRLESSSLATQARHNLGVHSGRRLERS